MTDLKSALFLDFEACSIHPESWPIEIGIARIESGQVLSDSRLIRPAPGWDLDLWSVASESIHGISQDEGEDVTMVADWFRALDTGLYISDNPTYEQRWLIKLLAAAPPFVPVQIMYFEDYLNSTLPDEAAVEQTYEHLGLTDAPHRAAEDAARLARVCLHGQQIGEGGAAPEPD